MPNPIRIRYSISAMPSWVRAVILMPMIAMASMIRLRAVSMPMFAQVFDELLPKAASAVGASTSTPLIVPRM